MRSLQPEYLKSLSFSDSQLTVLRTLGEYQGKQQLYFQQTPETLHALQQWEPFEKGEELKPTRFEQR